MKIKIEYSEAESEMMKNVFQVFGKEYGVAEQIHYGIELLKGLGKTQTDSGAAKITVDIRDSWDVEYDIHEEAVLAWNKLIIENKANIVATVSALKDIAGAVMKLKGLELKKLWDKTMKIYEHDWWN